MNTKMKNIQVRELTLVTSDLKTDLPLQPIEVVATLDRSIRSKDNKNDLKADGSLKNPYQGYRIRFKESNVVVVVEAGSILAAGEEAFNITKSGKDKIYELVANEMGLVKVGNNARVILQAE